MHRLAVASFLGVAGAVVNGSVAAYHAIATATADGPAVGDWITSGSSFSAAGALVYMVKKVTDGQLVASDKARVEAEYAELARRQLEQAEQAAKREDRLLVLYQAALTRTASSGKEEG